MAEDRNQTDCHEAAEARQMKAFGQALTVLRARAGMTKGQAAADFGTSPQGWGKYELGNAPSIFRPSVQGRLVKALGATVDELKREVALIAAPKPADEDWTEGGRFLELEDAQ